MRDAILHRGPDGNGEVDGGAAQLAACRLAIVDLQPRGLMPMSSTDGRFHIVHNGEIYNRLELREELLTADAHLRTTTDTEVILELYAREGEKMLDRLDGMFAFAIWDSQTQELFAARDRVGEKPFDYAIHEGRLYFASEPKALFAGGVPRQFNEETFAEIFTFRSAAGTRTPYQGVERLLPGHWMRAGREGVETGRWWAFPMDGQTSDKNALGQLLRDSVRRRLIADVPVGTFLSGGLDSSAVTALAAEMSDAPVSSFTVRYQGTEIDEGVYAEAVAASSRVDHHQIQTDWRDLPTLLSDATWHFDEPIAFPASSDMLAISRYARQHVHVLLTGESSDELLGGYGRLRLLRYPRLMSVTGRLLSPFQSQMRFGSRLDRSVSASRQSRADFIAASYADGDASRRNPAPLAEWAPFRAETAAWAVAMQREPVKQALAYERLTHLPAVIQTSDRMTMGAGIEARMPFTDPKILDYAALARVDDLFSGPHGKQPLRTAMVGKVPESVINRRKRGWTTPYWHFLREQPELRRWLTAMPDHEIVARSPIGRRRARAAVDGYLNGDRDSARDAWMLGRIVLWHQICVEGIRYPMNGKAG
jgi:asparagine synthase (glutamine-hydrolysing)